MNESGQKGVVTVRFFSVLRERTGKSQVVVPITEAATASEVVSRVTRDYPSIADYEGVWRIAVNKKYVQPDQQVTSGDEMALITPVSGG